MVSQAISNAEKAGNAKVANTLQDRVKQAQQWLRCPAAFHDGNGKLIAIKTSQLNSFPIENLEKIW